MENDLLFDYGPLWNRRERSHDKYFMNFKTFPVPVGITAGPIITQKSIIVNNELQNENLEEVTEQREVKSVEITTRNFIKKKFPLKFDPCMRPVEDVPSRLVLPGSLGKRYHHSSVLSSYTLDNRNHLIYGQPNQDSCTLKFARISQEGKNIKLSNAQEIFNYKSLSKTDSVVFHGTPQMLFLVDNILKFVKVKEESFDLCPIKERNILNCCLSRDISSRLAYVRQDGTVNIFNLEEEKNTWSGEFDVSLRSGEEYLECEFGHNPSYVNVACDSKVFLVDIRLPAEYGSQTIFNLTKSGEYLQGKNEIICGMKRVPNLPFVYVSCSDTLLLMDSRQCKHPVLTWSHMIRGRPSFSQYFRDCDIDYHIMADPLTSRLCVTSSISEGAEYPSISSISMPRHLNLINDTFAEARKRGLFYTDHIENQICSEMVGLTILPMEIGNVVCLQNNYGNLFSLTAVNRKVKSISTDDEKCLIKSLKKFEKSLLKPKKKSKVKTQFGLSKRSKIKRQQVRYCEGLRLRQCFTYKGKSIQQDNDSNKVIWNINIISKLKNYSKFYKASTKLNKAGKRTLLSYFSPEDQKIFGDEYLESCSDAVSEKFLSIWNEEEEEKQKNSPLKKGKRKRRREFKVAPYNSSPGFLAEDISHPLLAVVIEDNDADSTVNGNENANDDNNVDISSHNANNDSTTINDSYNASCTNSILMNDSASENAKFLKPKSKKRKSCANGF